MELPTHKAFARETELPGSGVNPEEQLPIIRHRYFFASGFCRGKTVLEVGCGPALGLPWLSGEARIFVGGDIVLDTLKTARKHFGARARLVNLDAHRLPFPDQSFDTVLSLAAIIYYDLPVFLQQSHRIISPGGSLILNTPNRDIPGFQPSALSHRYYSVPELDALLRTHGFRGSFFGAFPLSPSVPASAPGIKTRLARPLFNLPRSSIKKAGRLVSALPGGNLLKGFLVSRLYHRIPLASELSPADLELARRIPTVEIPAEDPDHTYRVIYVVARRG